MNERNAMNAEQKQSSPGAVQMPASAGWPLVAAFGLSLVCAGLLTHWMVSALGAVCLVAGFVGWFREVLPHEAHEPIPVESRPAEAVTLGLTPSRDARLLQIGEQGHRARLPLEIYPYSAGIVGGLVGGVAMAVMAILYGIIGQGSIWYPINLLAAAGSATISAMSHDQLLAFNGTGLVLAIIFHTIGSALIGLLYGIALPMFPRRPFLLGGILAPLFWSGILHAGLDIINPALEARIDWPWFMAAQFAFGVVAGLVVARRTRISTMQHLPFAIRAGIETPDTMKEKDGEDPKS
jgi:hypothetical protein